jgi:outer membrane protein, multidrug efflux system
MLVASFAGCVAGCMVGPDYVKPVVDTPAAYIYGDKEAQKTANLWL